MDVQRPYGSLPRGCGNGNYAVVKITTLWECVLHEGLRQPGGCRRRIKAGTAALLFPRHHGVVEPIVGQALVALDSRIAERRVFVATKGENGLVHLLGVEHFEAD